MEWVKKGLIYCPDRLSSWQNNSFMTPTPFLFNECTIRIYGGFRDREGISRLGYIDVDADNPRIVKKVSNTPILDIGRPGTFDDNGLILGDVIRVDAKIYLYYVGFQKAEKVKFLAFSGLAISDDNGSTFTKYSECPILDRCNNALYFKAIHSVIRENNIFRIWYALGSNWKMINNQIYPSYYIRYTESEDGINFCDNIGSECINANKNEYRIGRPRVYKNAQKYEMRYTYDTFDKEYRSGYAESVDGITWERMDCKAGLPVSEEGWDSEMLCYPAIFTHKNKTYMFYSGNGMGKTGVGYAELKN
jgi:hypothetical protein